MVASPLIRWQTRTGSVPSFPGTTKSKSDQSSVREFWIGEPLMMIRCGVSKRLTAGVAAVSTPSL